MQKKSPEPKRMTTTFIHGTFRKQSLLSRVSKKPLLFRRKTPTITRVSKKSLLSLSAYVSRMKRYELWRIRALQADELTDIILSGAPKNLVHEKNSLSNNTTRTTCSFSSNRQTSEQPTRTTNEPIINGHPAPARARGSLR